MAHDHVPEEVAEMVMRPVETLLEGIDGVNVDEQEDHATLRVIVDGNYYLVAVRPIPVTGGTLSASATY